MAQDTAHPLTLSAGDSIANRIGPAIMRAAIKLSNRAHTFMISKDG